MVAATSLIAEALGQRYVEAIPLSIERVWEGSAPNIPVICLLSPGVDSHFRQYRASIPQLLVQKRSVFISRLRSLSEMTAETAG